MSKAKEAVRHVRAWLRDLRTPKMQRWNDRYDADTVRIIASLPKKSTCIDIGAAKGSVLSEMIRAVPEGSFFAFEARPDAAAKLQQNFPKATVHWMALGDEAGEATFNVIPEYPGRSGLRRQKYPGKYTVNEITVPVERLDNVIPPDVQVDLIKIDVEGAEYRVLQGAVELCRRCNPIIVFEYGAAGRDEYGTSPQMMFDLLNGLGLEISHLSSWLAGKSVMTAPAFERACRSHWYFIAHPPR